MRQALELALKALEEFGEHYNWCHQFPTYASPEEYPPCNCGYDKAITAIKEALAQPEEEKLHPVHIGVDVTREGTAVTAFYRKPDAVMEMFYSQFHPLAQPEQEPVAWWIPKAEQFCLPSSDGTRPFAKAWEPLYTTPPQRKEPEQEISVAVLQAITNAGLTLLKTQHGYELRKLGPTIAHGIKE